MERYMDENWRQSMRIRLDYNNMMSSSLGNKGIYRREFDSIQNQIESAVTNMDIKRAEMRWRELPYNQMEVSQEIKEVAEHIRTTFDYFVVLGFGGSVLGPQAVHQALDHLYYNDLLKDKRGGPKIYFLDNIDPERIAALLDIIDIRKTVFNVISKSGYTQETISLLLIITSLLHEELGTDISSHLYVTTTNNSEPLNRIAKKENLKVFFIPEGIEGRFSELSPVGLLPASVTGINIEEFLSGAAFMERICSNSRDIFSNPAYMLGILQCVAMKHGCNINVLMPYSDALSAIAGWFDYLWSESLSKKIDRSGRIVRTGQTPVRVQGATDQYSKAQLFTEGPYDKVITFLAVENFRSEIIIEDGYFEESDISFLCGHSENELIKADRLATEQAIAKSGHLNNTIILPAINPFTVGELIMLLEMTAAFTTELLNINPIEHAGQKEINQAVSAILGRIGSENSIDQVNDSQKDPMQIV